MAIVAAPGVISAEASDTQLMLVQPMMLEVVWDRVVPLLEKGRRYWEVFANMEDIKQLIAKGEFYLWLFIKDEEFTLAAITAFTDYPQIRTIRLLWLGGSELSLSLDKLEQIELWGHQYGARRFEVCGREGFVRLLHSRGYRPEAVLLSKDLSYMTRH